MAFWVSDRTALHVFLFLEGQEKQFLLLNRPRAKCFLVDAVHLHRYLVYVRVQLWDRVCGTNVAVFHFDERVFYLWGDEQDVGDEFPAGVVLSLV